VSKEAARRRKFIFGAVEFGTSLVHWREVIECFDGREQWSKSRLLTDRTLQFCCYCGGGGLVSISYAMPAEKPPTNSNDTSIPTLRWRARSKKGSAVRGPGTVSTIVPKLEWKLCSRGPVEANLFANEHGEWGMLIDAEPPLAISHWSIEHVASSNAPRFSRYRRCCIERSFRACSVASL